MPFGWNLSCFSNFSVAGVINVCRYFTHVVCQPFGAIPSSSDMFCVLDVVLCLVFVASSERKIGLLPSMALRISVTTCDTCATDHVLRFTGPSTFGFCILQAIKNWSQGIPGNEAIR